MTKFFPTSSLPQCFDPPSESSTSHPPAPAQQGPQEASTSSPGLRRDHPSPALRSALLDLPDDLQVKIARHLEDRDSLANLRLSCRTLKSAASKAVKHVIVRNSEDLQAAIETYKEGRITALTVADPLLTADDLLLLQDLPGLKRLNLAGCRQLTAEGLAHLRHLPALQQLNLATCRLLTDKGLAHLRHLPALQQLNLAGCKLLTDNGLAHLRHLTALQQLNLSWNENLTDNGLAHLRHLTALQLLRLVECPRISNAGMEDLRSQLTNCVVTRGFA